MRAIRIALAVVAVLLSLCGPTSAQDWTFNPEAERLAGMRLLVWDPTIPCEDLFDPSCEPGSYITMTFDALLAGLVAFDDGVKRYIALKEYDPASPTRPAFTEADFLAGTEIDGQLVGASFPALAQGVTGVWFAVAVPETTGIGYLFIGQVNTGNRLPDLAEELAGTISIDGVSGYGVWAGVRPQGAFIFASGWYMFFDATAAPPTP